MDSAMCAIKILLIFHECWLVFFHLCQHDRNILIVLIFISMIIYKGNKFHVLINYFLLHELYVLYFVYVNLHN